MNRITPADEIALLQLLYAGCQLRTSPPTGRSRRGRPAATLTSVLAALAAVLRYPAISSPVEITDTLRVSLRW